MHSNVITSYYIEYTETLGKLESLLRILLTEKAEDQGVPKSSNFNTLEGRFYEICIQSILRLFKSSFKIIKTRQGISNDTILYITKAIGDILFNILKHSEISDSNSKQNFLTCSLIEFITKVIFVEQNASLSIVYSFHQVGGIDFLIILLRHLQNISNSAAL